VSNDYTSPNTNPQDPHDAYADPNPKTLMTLTLTLTDPHGLIKKFLPTIPSRKSSLSANTLCNEICV